MSLHVLSFNEEAFALGMAKRMVELNYQVLWEPSEPLLVRYMLPSVGQVPGPAVLKHSVKMVKRWWDHGRIDTR